METVQPIPEQKPKKIPFINGKVAGLGFVILTILIYLVPQILLVIAPLAATQEDSNIMGIVIIALSAIVGLMVGLLVKRNPCLNGLVTGLLTLIVVEIAIIPSSRMGLESLMQYALIVTLPVFIGAIIGGVLKKLKSK